MKNTIYKYIFYEFSVYFITALLALSSIVWTVQAVNYLDLVTEDGHAFSIYFLYSLLTLSKILTKLIPFCFLLACVFTILKLEKDNELIILWSSGLNKIYIVNYLIRISLIIMFLQLTLTTIINPKLLHLSRTVLKNSEFEFVSSMFKEKKFNDAVEGLTVFIGKKNNDKSYSDLLIRDESSVITSAGSKSSTIFAKSGYVSKDETKLILQNGFIHKKDYANKIDVVKFEKTTLNIKGISTKSINKPKIQETKTLDMIRCIRRNLDTHKTKFEVTHNCQKTKRGIMDTRIELNKRFGMPFFIPVIALVCSFLLSSRRDKKTYIYNKYIYFFISFVILTIAEITVRYSGNSWSHSAVYYLIPIATIPLFYFTLLKKFKYENLF
jgi:lipopolysaccharide export system permease protein